MGTRNLTAVIKDGEYKVAQYGQWDGYPEGQGTTVYNFIKGAGNLVKLENNLANTRWATDADFTKAYDAIGANTEGWITMEQGEQLNALFPAFSRDTCAEILNFVANAEGEIVLKDEHEFLNDTLFCEWAYVINFDTNELLVYAGETTPRVSFPLGGLPETADEFYAKCHDHKLVELS
jgi:hypothetical protein